jgi:hypothetical protein
MAVAAAVVAETEIPGTTLAMVATADFPAAGQDRVALGLCQAPPATAVLAGEVLSA